MTVALIVAHSVWWLIDPLHDEGYQFWSGIGSDLGELPLIVACVVLIRHHNCHVHGCYRLGHRDPAHGFPACRRHHSMRDQHGVDPNA